ncbi:MAG: RsmB/NOP family class I SAM-dependent RNA methyltransferase [Alphaproteobacteria bacterium]|nr:RsmB/NOP family class I SAM-dependent RNA methyltransferase [Alphaproteobacteria bacterium]
MEQAEKPQSEALSARVVALSLLGDVLSRRLALDHALAADKAFAALSTRDRAFVRMLVTTCLRRMGQVDDLISRAMDRRGPASPPLLQNVLRIGVTQIAFMDVPDYAIVDTGVNLAEQAGLSRQKGLVNAVLRRVISEGRDWFLKQDEGRLNVPQWLMQVWIEDFGLRVAAEIAQASLAEAPLDITVKDEADRDHWAQELQATILPSGSIRRSGGGMVTELPGFADGMWWVQDAAAALPVQLLGDVKGRTVVDMCAAPGGKTMQLAARGATVHALDRSMPRLKILEENLRRVRLESDVTVEAVDGAVWRAQQPVDFILLDAPCTATGTVRRHPDVMHLKEPKDMTRLVDTQARLLENACNMLAPGGVVVYCTCSLQKDESERQIEKILATRKDMQRVAVRPQELGDIKGIITTEGDVRVLPFHLAAYGGMDGFFISRLQKVSAA